MNRRDFIQKASAAGMTILFAGKTYESKGIISINNKKSIHKTDSVKNNINDSKITDNCVCLGMYDPNSASFQIEKNIISKLGTNWLSKGDSIFIKVSSNSGNPHPAVTSPVAISIIVKILKDAGAGEILIGDQAGVQHVRLTRKGRKNSTKDILSRNGILNAITTTKSKLHCFDDFGWDSYYEPLLDFSNHWGNELFIPEVIKNVDHIIYLPRLGSHCFSGYSSGLKNAVGFLRDDSRLSLHREGENFHKKIAELNYIPEIRNKLRFVFTIADKALLHFGPDMGKVHNIDKLMVIASNNIVQHDYLSASILNRLNHTYGSIFKYTPKFHFPASMSWNNSLVKSTWGKEERKKTSNISAFVLDDIIRNHPSLSHYCDISNFHPSEINVFIDMKLDIEFKEYLNKFGNGIFNLV